MATLAGRPVGRVGYGAMQLESADRGAATAVLRRAVELGVNHIDTAEFYGADGHVNDLIRAALHPYPDELLLVSKVGAVREGGTLVAAQQPAQLRAQVEDNLRRLGTDHLAVVNLRRADSPPGIVAEGDQVVPLADQLAELVTLRDAGTIGGIGLSSVAASQLREALPVGIACVQNLYNLLERGDEPMLRESVEHDVGWVPFFPLGSGRPGRPRVTDAPEVRAAAERLGATPGQVGLAWLLGVDPHVLLIPGTSSVAHLEQNLAAADLRLDTATTAALDAITATME